MIKTVKYIAFAAAALSALGLSSCKNAENDFPDYEGGVSAFFAYQYPVRTITLGDDKQVDNSMDKNHQFYIFATQGGAYKSRDLKIDVVVDNSLTDNLTFPDGSPVKALPSNYYSMASTTLTKVEDYLFGTVVTLSDAFFQDPDAVKQTYVVPLRMVQAIGADRIIDGEAFNPQSNPALTDKTGWKVQPKNYVLYCVRFINEWHGSYCRRGTDNITDKASGATSVVTRKAEAVEKDQVVYLSTESLNTAIFPLEIQYSDGNEAKLLTCELKLTFGNDGKCSISTDTPGMSASGSGQWVKGGEKNSINNEDCDALYLNYDVDFGPVKYSTSDILVMRHREVVGVTDFNPVYNK